MPENRENEATARKKKIQIVPPEDDMAAPVETTDPKTDDDSTGVPKPLGDHKP
ncbi:MULTISPECIES: hypothetical protein [unclassified Streptomyces]|uniref:hypothetical protein n=1 Tax=unclassified Streptomyces TaxID=2593676 RepID=UPI000A8B48B1|nr:hypothetical protein [Streptomyces sp. CNQ-509]